MDLSKWRISTVNNEEVAKNEKKMCSHSGILDRIGFSVLPPFKDDNDRLWQHVYVHIGMNKVHKYHWQKTDLIGFFMYFDNKDLGCITRVTPSKKKELKKVYGGPGKRLRIRSLLPAEPDGNTNQLRVRYDHGPDLPTLEEWPGIYPLTIVSEEEDHIVVFWPNCSIEEYKRKRI